MSESISSNDTFSFMALKEEMVPTGIWESGIYASTSQFHKISLVLRKVNATVLIFVALTICFLLQEGNNGGLIDASFAEGFKLFLLNWGFRVNLTFLRSFGNSWDWGQYSCYLKSTVLGFLTILRRLGIRSTDDLLEVLCL